MAAGWVNWAARAAAGWAMRAEDLEESIIFIGVGVVQQVVASVVGRQLKEMSLNSAHHRESLSNARAFDGHALLHARAADGQRMSSSRRSQSSPIVAGDRTGSCGEGSWRRAPYVQPSSQRQRRHAGLKSGDATTSPHAPAWWRLQLVDNAWHHAVLGYRT